MNYKNKGHIIKYPSHYTPNLGKTPDLSMEIDGLEITCRYYPGFDHLMLRICIGNYNTKNYYFSLYD